MKRIGLTGTNWTGKSTTIELIKRKHPNLFDSHIVLSNLISQCPHPTVKNQTFETSAWMLEKVSTALNDNHNQTGIEVFDRTPIDILAFTRYAAERDKLLDPKELMNKIANLLGYFDVIFYLEPNLEWPVISKSTEDIAFALLMQNYFKRIVQEYNISVVKLPWELEQRCNIIIETLNKIK